MPIYEYECCDCGHKMEVLQKMSDPALKDCPQCGKPSLNKKISAAGFRLAGSGWYETDFKSGANKKNLHASDDAAAKAKPKDAAAASASSGSTPTPSASSKATPTAGSKD